MDLLNDAGLYGADYFGGYAYDHDPKRALAYQQEARRVIALRPSGGNILDVGCGTGGFLRCFDDRWDRYGIEPSDYAREIAKSRGVWCVKKFELERCIELFDVIVFRGTIQHINNPLENIAMAYEALKPGGMIVFLATPNTGGLVYRMFQELPALDPPRNWCLFSAKELTNILHRTGFQNIEAQYPYRQTPYTNPLRDMLRFALRCFGIKRPFAFPGNMMEVYAWKPG